VTVDDRPEYQKRVNRVLDHIQEHLADELTLADLARVAAFSPFHFHRVFTAITGETLFGFIQRVRIERAAGALSSHPDQSVLAVALDYGFMRCPSSRRPPTRSAARGRRSTDRGFRAAGTSQMTGRAS
jgi:AraC-like DNA-binding protein